MADVMNYIDRLVAELCPDGVDFYTIDELITLDFGTRITKSKDAGTIYPVYGGGGASFRTDNYNREDKYVVSRFAMSEKCVRYVSGKFWMLDSGFTYSVKDESLLSYKYISYWLLNAQQEIYACSSQSAQRNLKTAEFKRFEVPVPPLEIQEAIVEILDKFTNLEAELEAELEVRRAQYEHYRTHLLSYESLAARGQVRWCALGDVVRICNGRDYKTLSAGDVPVYGSGGVMTYVSDYLSVGPTVLIPRKGSLDNIYFVEGQFWTVDTIFYTEIGDALHPKFFFHYMKQMKLSRMNEAAGVPSMTQRKLSSIRIPIPSYEEQRRIADLLDRFDALVNDISSGLPAEIAARRAQYEHYRDRLLSFPEKAASGDDAS